MYAMRQPMTMWKQHARNMFEYWIHIYCLSKIGCTKITSVEVHGLGMCRASLRASFGALCRASFGQSLRASSTTDSWMRCITQLTTTHFMFLHHWNFDKSNMLTTTKITQRPKIQNPKVRQSEHSKNQIVENATKTNTANF